MADTRIRARDREAFGFRELIAFVASLMALNALSIDIMLPALPDIGASFGLAEENKRQLVITAYVFGFGLAQLVYGPLADTFGRRKVLLAALVGYIAATLLCAAAPSFSMMLGARVLQGVAAASTRVIAMAVVRDMVHGRRMAEVMSFAMTVFMAAPILAPSLGQLVLFAGPWRFVYVALLLAGTGLLAWTWFRLPETLPRGERYDLRLGAVARNYLIACSQPVTLGYMLASCFIFAGLFSFIAMSEQIFAEQFALGAMFPIAFAGIAGGLCVSSLLNARLVQRFGMRRLSHGALCAFVALSALNAALTATGLTGFWIFYPLFAATMFLFGMIGANFSSLVMEPAGKRAGTTAAAFGAATSVFGAVLGGAIGLAYNGTVLPLVLGHAVLGGIGLVIVLITERGKLFGVGEPHQDGVEAQPSEATSTPGGIG